MYLKRQNKTKEKVKIMNETVGKRCLICDQEIKNSDETKTCASCGTIYHKACWEENNGCAIEGCNENHQKGNANHDSVCKKCGAKLEPGQKFCPSCGNRVNDSEQKVTSEENQNSINVSKQKKNKIILLTSIVAVVIVAVIVLVIVFGGNRRKVNFSKLYEKYCDPAWSELAEDKSYLSIDTNPNNYDNDGLASPSAYEAVKSINSTLGLPESLNKSIEETSSNDGRLTEEYDDLGIMIYWTYHPDQGLEITYKYIK